MGKQGEPIGHWLISVPYVLVVTYHWCCQMLRYCWPTGQFIKN